MRTTIGLAIMLLAVGCAKGAERSTARAASLATLTPPAGYSPVLVDSASVYRATDSAGMPRLRLTGRRYLTQRIAHRGQDLRRVLLRESVDTYCCLGGERDTYARIRLDGWRSVDQSANPPDWSTSLRADGGELRGDFYIATLYGCCDVSDARFYVNAENGRLAFINSTDAALASLPELNVPNSSLRRYVALLDTYADTSLADAQHDSSVVGVLQYGDGEHPSMRYLLRLAGLAKDWRGDSLGFHVAGDTTNHNEVDLWSANGREAPSALSGFEVVVRLVNTEEDSAVTLRIPVSHDRLQLDSRTFRGWSLRPLPTRREAP